MHYPNYVMINDFRKTMINRDYNKRSYLSGVLSAASIIGMVVVLRRV